MTTLKIEMPTRDMGRIFIDGVEVPKVFKFEVVANVGEPAAAIIHLYVDEIEGEISDIDIRKSPSLY